MEDYVEMFEQYQAMLAEVGIGPEFLYLVGIVYLAIVLAVGLTVYLLGAVGLRRLAIRTGQAHPVFAFIPVLRWVTFGKLAEREIDSKAGRTIAFSVHLPVLHTLRVLLSGVYGFFVGISLWEKVSGEAVSSVPSRYQGLANGFSVASTIIGLILTVMMIYAIYRIFRQFENSSPTVLTVLCALIDVILPILLLAFRNRPLLPEVTPGQSGDGHEKGNGNGNGNGNGSDNGGGDDGFYYDK